MVDRGCPVCRGSLQSAEALWAELCQLYRRAELLLEGDVKTVINCKCVLLLQRICQFDHKHALAQYNLAIMYMEGGGVQKDMQQAAVWHMKAAEQGLAESQLNLDMMCMNGDGVEKDMQQAVMCYRRAAEQGLVEAQHSLVILHRRGDGVDKDMQRAVIWCKKAAEQGHAQAQCNLVVVHLIGDGVSIKRGFDQAGRWFQKAARQGGYAFSAHESLREDEARDV